MSIPKLRQDVFNGSKRKSWDCASQSNETDEEWQSSSATIPINRKRKAQPIWTSARREEVGDSDELHIPGRRQLGQTSKGFGKGKIESAQLREGLITDYRPTLKITENNAEDKTNKIVADCSPKAKEKLNNARSYMQNVLEELGESRKQWLQWMRQEMHAILYECSNSPGVPTNLAGKGGEKVEYENQEPPRVPMIKTSGCEDVGMRFGSQGSAMARVGFVGQGNGGNAGYCHQSNGSGERSHNSLSEQHKSGGVATAFVGEKDMRMDPAVGSRDIKVSDLVEKTGETAGLVGSYKGRVGIPSLGGQTGGDSRLEFHTQPDLRVYSRFGAQGCDGGGIEYGSDGTAAILGGQAAENAGHDNGKRLPDIRSSGNPNPVNNGVGSSQCMPLMMSSQARATDLIGMQIHSSVGMQNPLAMNMVWRMMQQSQRNDRCPVPGLQVPIANYEEHVKMLNGDTGPCRGMIHSSSNFQSKIAKMDPGDTHCAGMALGMNLPSAPLGNASLSSSSGMPIFIGMQNLVAMRSSSEKQNFLGLSTNGFTGGGSMNRRGSPAVFMQHSPHQSISSGRGASLAASPGMSHKFCSFMQRMDTLELNT
eukprot:c27332_g1_i2 orf=844-2622(+)